MTGTVLAQSTSLFFVALLPPLEIQEHVTQIKQYFYEHYASRHALKSPPHVTLQPPFKWSNERVPRLEQCLRDFVDNRESIPVMLSGFGAFLPRVIYVDVLKTPQLLTLQKELMAHLETELGIVDPVSKTRPFSPHMTVAFKDLTRQKFKLAWQEFQQRQLQFEFVAMGLTLLVHDGKQWNISSEFQFNAQ